LLLIKDNGSGFLSLCPLCLEWQRGFLLALG
jgi:hypothetical protein